MEKELKNNNMSTPFKKREWRPFTQKKTKEEVEVTKEEVDVTKKGEKKEEVVEKKDPFLENLKKTNPDAYSTKHPTSGDTLYYIKQDGKWVQTW